MVTRLLFTAFVAMVAYQRMHELRRSRRQVRALLLRGGREYVRWQAPALAALHTAWLSASIAEVWWLQPSFRPVAAGLALLVFAAGQSMRIAAMRALGDRWTIPVITLPGARPVASGVYRYLRHPNYLGVILEIAALPLIHGAVWSAVIFSIANGLLLTARIRAEERALAAACADPDERRARWRFIPSVSRRRASHDP